MKSPRGTRLRSRISTTFEDVNYRNAFVFVVGLNLLLIMSFYNKGWLPNDDGWYSHVANRILKGQVFPRDIEELHPGYIHFVHAASMRLFGATLVAMRYPLMALMAIQSLTVFLLFRRTGWFVATTAAVVIATIGTLEVATPTPSLYAEALAIGAAALLITTSPTSRFRLLSLGLLVGTAFMFRQLSAVFVVMAAFVFLFTENQDDRVAAGHTDETVENRWWSRIGAQATLVLLALMLLYYLDTSASPFAWVFFGTTPLIVLAWALGSVTISNKRFFSTMLQVGTGSLLATVPLVAYLLYHQSFGLWIDDTFIHSFKINNPETNAWASFWAQYVEPAVSNIVIGGFIPKLNGVYFLFLLGSSLILAIAVLRRLYGVQRLNKQAGRTVGLPRSYALPLIALFHAQVTIISEVPYYLYLTVGFTLIASLWIWKEIPPAGLTTADDSQERLRKTHFGFVWFAILIALVFHAGQPYTRHPTWTVAGRQVILADSVTPNLGLKIPPTEDIRYRELVDVINANSEPDDQLFAMPNLAEIYLFAERDNAFRIINPTVSLTNDEEVGAFVERFNATPPEIVVIDPLSSYNAGATLDLREILLPDYDFIETVQRFDVYKRRPDAG